MSGLVSWTTLRRNSADASSSSFASSIHSSLNPVGRKSRSAAHAGGRRSIQSNCPEHGILPKLTRVTRTPRCRSPVTSSRVYVQTPPTVSVVIKMCMLEFLDGHRPLLLNVAVTFTAKRGCVVVVSPLPGGVIGQGAKSFGVERTPGEREHRDRFADPHTAGLQMV